MPKSLILIPRSEKAMEVPGISAGRVELTEAIIYHQMYEQQLNKLEGIPILKASRINIERIS